MQQCSDTTSTLRPHLTSRKQDVWERARARPVCDSFDETRTEKNFRADRRRYRQKARAEPPCDPHPRHRILLGGSSLPPSMTGPHSRGGFEMHSFCGGVASGIWVGKESPMKFHSEEVAPYFIRSGYVLKVHLCLILLCEITCTCSFRT